MSKYIYCSSPGRTYASLSSHVLFLRVDHGMSATFVTLSYGYYPLVYLGSCMLRRAEGSAEEECSRLLLFLSPFRLRSFSPTPRFLHFVSSCTRARATCMRVYNKCCVYVCMWMYLYFGELSEEVRNDIFVCYLLNVC